MLCEFELCVLEGKGVDQVFYAALHGLELWRWLAFDDDFYVSNYSLNKACHGFSGRTTCRINTVYGLGVGDIFQLCKRENSRYLVHGYVTFQTVQPESTHVDTTRCPAGILQSSHSFLCFFSIFIASFGHGLDTF